MGAAHRGREAGILDRAGEQAEARIEKRGVDPVEIHVDDARVRVEPALFTLGIFEAVELDGTLPYSDRAEAADPPRIAQHFALDAEPLLAVLVDHKPRPALAEFGICLFVPEIEWLQNVAVRIDSVVGESHHPSSFGYA